MEPITSTDDPLANYPNVVVTAHIGFVTEDEFELQFSDIFDQVVAFDAGAPIHMTNYDQSGSLGALKYRPTNRVIDGVVERPKLRIL